MSMHLNFECSKQRDSFVHAPHLNKLIKKKESVNGQCQHQPVSFSALLSVLLLAFQSAQFCSPSFQLICLSFLINFFVHDGWIKGCSETRDTPEGYSMCQDLASLVIFMFNVNSMRGYQKVQLNFLVNRNEKTRKSKKSTTTDCGLHGFVSI